MRIIIAMAGREMTAQQLSEKLGDVAPATLYRHINLLAKAGVLTVAAEHQVRGTLEKVYTLNQQLVHMDAQQFSSLSRDDHVRFFTTFVATLLDDFSRYINNAKKIDPISDGVGYQKFPLELSDEEFVEVAKGINAVIIPHLNNTAAPGRKRRLFATIVMPDLDISNTLNGNEQKKLDKETE
jgi:DNA-binding transcriptional ArsR family regulator